MGRRPLPKRIAALDPKPLTSGTTCGISSPFGLLFHTSGQVTYVLRTHSPLRDRIATISSFDLHVLSTPPAFILSQDQTLRRNFVIRLLTQPDRRRSFASPQRSDSSSLVSSYHSSVVKVPAFARRLVSSGGRAGGCYHPHSRLSRP